SSSACPSERTSSVLPSPGAPSSRQWPPASRPISSCSTTACWPTTAWASAPRSSPRRGSRESRSWEEAVMRSPVRSVRQCVHHDVHTELRVVFGEEAFVAPVVVPFAAVVFVAVEHAQPAIDLDALEVVVHQVIAPAVELEAGGRRAVGELEEAVVDGVTVGQLLQRGGAEDRTHLRLERGGE